MVTPADDVLWEFPEHTKAKHLILKTYFQAWSAILSQQAKRIGAYDDELLFFDGFAGPGVSASGEPGSPMLALEAILDHSITLPIPVRLMFVEKNKNTFTKLEDTLRPIIERVEQSNQNIIVDPRRGNCRDEVTSLVDDPPESTKAAGASTVLSGSIWVLGNPDVDDS